MSRVSSRFRTQKGPPMWTTLFSIASLISFSLLLTALAMTLSELRS